MPILLYLLFPFADLSAQGGGLPPEILNRPARLCSSPPPVESAHDGRLWPAGVVPYVFDGNTVSAQQAAMRAAMQEWENAAPVRFVPRTAEPDFLHIKDDPGNWSHVGRIGGRQEMGIFNWNYKFIMAHELCHALGFHHEHQRPDRDTFISVSPAKQGDPNYRVERSALAIGPYDLDSVMHYPGADITVRGDFNRVWQSRIGQRARLSPGDVAAMQVVYGAKRRAPWPYGFPAAASDFVPSFHTGGEFAAAGNGRFGVTAQNLTGGTAGVLLLSLDKSCLLLPGLTVYADPLQGMAIGVAATGTYGKPGEGAVSLALPLPNHPWLAGIRLHLQGFFVEPNLSLCHTHGLWATIQAAVPPEVAVLHDREAYRRYATGAAAGLTLWQAHAVPGFTYVKTEQFQCGGQAHWMAIVRHAQTGLEFCLIPGGSFRMGDSLGTAWNSDLPVHWVRVRPFLLARTEVTQAQFAAVMGAAPWQGQPYVLAGPDHAASYIDWFDAGEFCARAGLRLPTEAEWEYACRAGVETCYHFGENYNPASPPARLGLYAWYEANAWSANPPEKYAHPVGRLLPNPFGLHDMCGNQWEWCEDNWHSTYQRAPADGGAWLDSTFGRIYRGGCWFSAPMGCRSCYRSAGNPGLRSEDLGFRPAGPRL